MDVKNNVQKVKTEIEQACQRAGRSSKDVSVIAVTKYVDSDLAAQVFQAGLQDIGENRVDKFLEKYQALKEYDLTWHLIGSLQRRKVKDVIDYVDYFHALDSLKLAQEIQKRSKKTVKCFLQVNISGEESKHGFAPHEIDSVLDQLKDLDKIELVGLMTMAPFEADEDQLHQLFQEAHTLQTQIKNKKIKNMPFTELSMGMSGDYPLAIQHGATFVRIGSAFFK